MLISPFPLLFAEPYGTTPIEGQRQEVCQWEEYSATCGEDEVIVMTAAKYGRMELGGCVDRDFGYLGCGANVLPKLDAHCSGKQSCKFPVTTLHEDTECGKSLTGYLDAEHICLQGEAGVLSFTCMCFAILF